MLNWTDIQQLPELTNPIIPDLPEVEQIFTSNPVLLFKDNKYYCVKLTRCVFSDGDTEMYWQQEDVAETLPLEPTDRWASFNLYK